MTLDGLSIIGQHRGARGGKIFMGIDPATGAVLPVEFHSASVAGIEEAVRLSDAAFLPFARWTAAQRADLLRRIAAGLEADAAEIIARARLETALPQARMEGELARTCYQLRLYADAAARGLCAGARLDHGDPNRKPQPKPDLRSVGRPVGPVAVFGASNFPLAFSVAGGDTASALAAGCPVIVKAHPAHPGTSEIVGQIMQRAMAESGAPEGIFSLLFDAGHEAGIALVKHPLIKAVGFTGSRRGGRALMDLAAARREPIPVFAEMSSVNPVFILAGALRDKAEEIATGLYSSVVLGVGQFCTNPGLVFIEKGAGSEQFIAALKLLFTNSPAGMMLTAGICSAYRAGVDALRRTSGVECAAIAEGAAGAALFLASAGTFLGNAALMDEVFGPSTLIIECASRDEMIEAARRIEGQLTATIHATVAELAEAPDLVEILSTKAGRLLFNGFPTGVEVAHAMIHGGPYPATSNGHFTSVGTRAIERFQRPVCYQNFPEAALPAELREENPLHIPRLIDGETRIANRAG